MSSSIEEQFDPPEWATREEVIKAARHYINYWKIEARQRNAQWLEAIKPKDSAWQPIETAPKDMTQVLGYVENGYVEDSVVVMCWFTYANGRACWETVDGESEVDPTHWMPLPNPPPAKEGKPNA